MRIAVAIQGNLRTFLMPLREDPSMRVCDVFMKYIANPNNADVFAATDTTAFYHNGVEYFSSKRTDIYHDNSFRMHNKNKLIEGNVARNIIKNELQSVIEDRLKAYSIADDLNVANDEKTKLLANHTGGGASPELIVQQYLKLKKCRELILNYEKNNEFKYDVIIKCRFDNMYNSELIARNYDYQNVDIYSPGMKNPMILDWYGFGTRDAMLKYLNIYENLGTIIPAGPMFIHECEKCGTSIEYGAHSTPNNKTCQNCNNDNIISNDIAISSEHHIFRMCAANGIRVKGGGFFVYVYRFKDTSDHGPITNELKGLGEDFTVLSHTGKTHEVFKGTK